MAKFYKQVLFPFKKIVA